MKINGIKALDYNIQNDNLVMVFAETTVEEILRLDTSLLTVKTDDGDTVEAFPGWNLKSVTYDVAAGSYVTVLDRKVDDLTARAVDQMRDELVNTRQLLDTATKQNIAMAENLDAVTAARAALDTVAPRLAAVEETSMVNTMALVDLASLVNANANAVMDIGGAISELKGETLEGEVTSPES